MTKNRSKALGLALALFVVISGDMAHGTTLAPMPVTGHGSAGTADTGVVTVQGIAGGTAIPVSGTFSSPSTGPTGSAVPSDATYIGAINGGNLIGVAADSGGNLVCVGDGTAGTPAGGVVSIQGVASGTNVPISAASLPLPTGAATAANQSTANTSLSSIDTKTPSLGQAAMAASVPVAIANNQSAIPASQSGTWNITNVSGTVSLPTGAATAAKQPALGTAGTPSTDVITVQGISSMTAFKVDGSAVTQPISAASLPLPTGAATSVNQSTGNSSLASIDGKMAALGQTIMTGSMPVTIASDQTPGIGRTSALLYRNDYSSVNVTTSAYVQVISSTASVINELCDFDSSGSAIIIATGGSGSEINQIYVPPGGASQCYDIHIASGTRIAIKALDTNATSGQIILTGLD